MQRTIVFIVISLSFLGCGFNPRQINPDKIIGENSSKIPYGSRGLYCSKYIGGNSYGVHGAFYKNKVIAYVMDTGIIVDYFFSDLVEYDKVKEIPLGISYNELVDILGEPVGLLYGSEYIEEIEKGSINDTFGATYFQKTKKPYSLFYGISNYVVVFGFTYDGKLKSIKELHQME
jgi:hypothetical protein